MTFGPAFSRALLDVSSALAPFAIGAPLPRWILSVFAYESGLQPSRTNHLGYSGLWQKSRNADGSLYIAGPGKLNPATQVRDYGLFTLAQLRTFGVASLPSLAHLYCLNLAPARAKSTVVYAHPNALLRDPSNAIGASPEELEEVRETGRRWPKAYAAQHSKLDPERKGWIRLADLEAPVLEAAKVLGKRIDDELAAMALLEPSPRP
jgi:hypothetical protein